MYPSVHIHRCSQRLDRSGNAVMIGSSLSDFTLSIVMIPLYSILGLTEDITERTAMSVNDSHKNSDICI